VNQVGSGAIIELKDAGVSKVVVDGNGNVGIGTENPIAKLYVNGHIRSFTPAFFARSTVNGNIVSNSQTNFKVPFNQTTVNITASFSIDTFTIPYSGVYKFRAVLSSYTGSGASSFQCVCKIRSSNPVNDNIVSTNQYFSTSSSWGITTTIDYIGEYNVGDTVYITTDTSSATLIYGLGSYFMGEMIA